MHEQTMLRLELDILNGHLPDGEVFRRMPEASLMASPILSKAYGEWLIRHGSLKEGVRMLGAAVKGLAAGGQQQHLPDAMALLAMAHIRAGNLADASTLLAFLREEFHRGMEAGGSGYVAHALAKGGHLIGEQESLTLYVQSAFDAYRQHPSFRLFGELLLDVWTGLVPPESLDMWAPQAAWAEQQHRLGNAPAAYAQFVAGLNHYHRGEWEEAAARWDGMDISALGHFYGCLAGVYHFRSLCRSPSRQKTLRQRDLTRLEGMLLTDEADLEVQFHAEMVRYEWWKLQEDKGKAASCRQRAEVLCELVRLPALQRELEDIRRPPAAKAAVTETLPAMRIYCFGGLRFVHNGQETREMLWKRKKTKELFLYLLLQPRFRAPRDHAVEALYGEADGEKMANRLYVAIHELKKMAQTLFGIPDAVFLKEGIIRLNESMIEYLDVEEYLTLSRVGEQLWRQDRELALEMFEKASQLYDDFLPEVVYLDWLEQFREMLASTHAGMLKRLAQHAAERQRFDQAESYVEEWLRVKPLQEDAHHAKISLLVRMGRKTDAKRWYDHWADICHQELGSQPMPDLKKLVFEG